MRRRLSSVDSSKPFSSQLVTRFPAVFLLTAALVGCSSGTPETAGNEAEERPYLLGRVEDAAIVQAYADGFEDLDEQNKELVWHLYQAAVAGRDIFYDQRYVHGLDMRDTFEAILRNSDGVDADALEEIERYAELFWLNSGPFNNLTAQKFIMNITPDAFSQAAHIAQANGAQFPTIGDESLDDLLARLERPFFDIDYDASVTTKSPEPGGDILTESANNLYQDVTLTDVATFTEKFGLNSRLVKRNGKLEEEVYRVGGLYDPQIREIIRHLEQAIPLATPEMAKSLEALIEWYRVGTAQARRAYDIAWVADTNSQVDTINGFTEVYMDPRGVKGSWEALVFYVNQQKTAGIKALAADAQWFEDNMPWADEYKKEGVQGITANAIDVVVETGDSGPVTPIGINLPNDSTVREQYGSKSVSLSNITEAYDKSTPEGFRTEFTWDAAEAARSERWGSLASELLTDMHEVIGHASGKLAAHVNGNPEAMIKEYYSALEEGRADLVGLYFINNPKLAELGLVDAADQAEVARTEYEGYTRNALVQLRRVREGDTIEEDHMRNRQMVVYWMMANTDAIEIRQRDGKTYYVMTDAEAFHEGVGRLLAEVQRIKSEGDYAGAKKLFDEYGVHFNPMLRDEVVARVEALDLPSYSGFVMPRLEPVMSGETITDVDISYPQDLETQMLHFAEMTSETRQEFREQRSQF